MKKTVALLLAAGTLVSVVAGCAYGGVAVVNDKAIIARNDAFLYGALRKVFVCKVADSGVSACAEGESP
ncbi:MAG: hypothetical protein JNL38_29150 [Myxococcales bacterium]|jgi:hypothetical protein|nr:hypothetical protein [Myxococcales bacterium]